MGNGGLEPQASRIGVCVCVCVCGESFPLKLGIGGRGDHSSIGP